MYDGNDESGARRATAIFTNLVHRYDHEVELAEQAEAEGKKPAWSLAQWRRWSGTPQKWMPREDCTP